MVILIYLKIPQATPFGNICGFVDLTHRSIYFSAYNLDILSLTQPKEEVWLFGTQPMLLRESYVCISHFRSVASNVSMAKIQFLSILNTGRSVSI